MAGAIRCVAAWAVEACPVVQCLWREKQSGTQVRQTCAARRPRRFVASSQPLVFVSALCKSTKLRGGERNFTYLVKKYTALKMAVCPCGAVSYPARKRGV